MKRSDVLDTAKQYVSKDRNTSYDEPERNFERIAAMWNVALEGAFKRGSVRPHEVALAMICVKLARIVTSPENDDHWIDLAGYAACGSECISDEFRDAISERIDDRFRPVGVLDDITEERRRQDEKWGVQDHEPIVWIPILGEEYGELCEAALALNAPHLHNPSGEYDLPPAQLRAAYRRELIQMAAVAVAMVESLDRNS